MLMAAVENGQHFWLVIVAVLLAAVSAYYYFKIIQAIYFKESETDSIVFEGTVTSPFKWMLLVIVALILMVGIYPEIIIGLLYA